MRVEEFYNQTKHIQEDDRRKQLKYVEELY